MEIPVAALRETLELLEPAIPRKPNLEMLKCVLLGSGRACATDLEATVQVELPEAQDRCVIPVKDALQLLRGIPGSLLIDINQLRDLLNLTWEDGNAEFQTHYPEDYPPVPGVNGAKLDLDERLIHALEEVVGYCSTDDTRPVLTGVTLTFGDELEVVAADGFRMAHTVVPISAPEEVRRQVIVPAQAVKLLSKLWKKSPGSSGIGKLNIAELVAARRRLELTLDKERACFRFGGVSLITNLIQGNPPEFRKLIPQETPRTVELFAPDLMRAVKQLEKVDDKIRLTWEGETLKVSAKGDEREGEIALSATTTGEPGRVAINAGYLRDYLKDKQGMVTMGVRNEREAVLFHSSSPVLVLVMPIFVQW